MMSSLRTFRADLKLRALLWGLGLLMRKASRDNPKFQAKLVGKQLTCLLGTRDGRIGRYYQVQNFQVHSSTQMLTEPDFKLLFRDAATGYALLTAQKGAQQAFMAALKQGDIDIHGQSGLLFWFQDAVRTALPRRRAPRTTA